MKRRDFIRMMGGMAVVTAGFAAMPPSIRKALAIGAHVRTGTIDDVQHVVILMQENRSFDHYFGSLRGVRGFKDRFPIPTVTGKPVWHQSNGQKEIQPFHLDATTMNAALVASMPHTFPDAQAAWDQGRMSEWTRYKTDASMGYYTRQEAPFQYALADAFTLCDAYHCSLHASTGPNRIVFWSGSNHDPLLRNRGINTDERSAEVLNLRTAISGTLPSPGYQYQGDPFLWPTIPELLESAGVSWKIYQDPNENWNGLMHGALASPSFRQAKPGSPYYEKGMRPYSVNDLRDDVLADRLPSVSWVLPTPLKSEHPGAPSSAAQGGNFVEQVLAALTANAEVWSKTVFFLCFDENDGFFDHVPPPAVPSVYPDGSLAGKSTMDVAGMYFVADTDKHLHPQDHAAGNIRPWGLGPRVPMYVVSPWSRGGWVNSQVFDHTSVGMFLEKRFGIEIPAISDWHRSISGDLTSAFDFADPNNTPWDALPDMSDYALIELHAKTMPKAAPPAEPQPLSQEPGVRLSRALPYALDVRLAQRDGAVVLAFENTGKQGAVLHVYDRRHPAQLPRRYTVEAGAWLEDDHWKPTGEDMGRYHLEVHGPAGFYREFRGHLAERGEVEVELLHDDDSAIGLAVRQPGEGELPVEIIANAYIDGGPWKRVITAATEFRQLWPSREQGHWYDFTVRGPGFEQRMAGRIETGRPSISDPAMA
ncbi:phosphocholine-specific phospholipase C [Dyella sp. C9]|uniref:phosphocholine-specific phospholipase C n=1 Tax=Dyella sp. C9 TaxID=2202154 RepID=UPI000DEEDCF2|nr:phospholipase C, phosphocholine-specific [Dyella sp. C9]